MAVVILLIGFFYIFKFRSTSAGGLGVTLTGDLFKP